MIDNPNAVPAAAIKSIATGLLMMAAFTILWAGIAFGSLNAGYYAYTLLIFPIFSGAFVVNAISLFRIAKHFPVLTSEDDKAEGKKMGMWFGIIFGAEGLLIFIAINIVINIGHANLTIPVIALVVGLHFYPMAKLFKRTIDYYLATWTTLIAIGAILLILNKTFPEAKVDAFVGIGTAISTTCYGLYMIYESRRLTKPVRLV
ncbi:MAG: hypothetical protein JWP37_761 [Mucilaginibacter sp.]|nr:hypothetical protein [Mucilaginibacter sp.]